MIKAYYIPSIRLVISCVLFIVCLLVSHADYGQILSYTNDSSGALNSVAINATGTRLSRVNGATHPGTPCSSGYSATAFSSATSYATTLPAIEITISPNTGFTLNVTGFTVDMRRSATGPANVRYAYSIDGGTTWTDQGTDQTPNNASCGTTTTASWATAVTVVAVGQLRFRVYGFNAASTTGTLQVLNLVINGAVTTSTGCGSPGGLNTSAITTTSATLNWTAVTGATSYNIEYRQSGTSIWSTTTSATNSVAVSGLTSNTIYDYQVQAVCTGGPGSYSTLAYFTTLVASTSSSSGKIAVYFNTPVNNSVSTGVNAIYLNHAFADTLVAYINRAKYTIDITQYDYNQSSGFANIATAINSCYSRGVRIRWIYDGSQANTGLALLNSGINKLASPTTSAYGIMHNKFVIIDANSTNPDDAIVCTGSEDWGVTQFNSNNNNILYIQDSALAHAYLNEFNMMWGDTGIVANTTLSKFGPYKTDLGAHIFHIGGKTVELYFSPSDHTDSHIQSSINSANTDLYFGVYTFTEATDANDIVALHNASVYTTGITDQYSSTTGSAYPILTSGLGSLMKTYSSPSLIYHNKMLIVDPSNTCSDPQVLTGSHNWTASADTKNDENTLIIHSDTISNIYYQSFYANYTALGGTLAAIAPCIATTCGTPSGLIATSITSTSALLNWTAMSGAISYTIQYRIVGTTIWSTISSATNSVVINSLTPASNYEFQVQTICTSGTSSFSSSTNFTTLATPCSIPTSLSATGITSTSATLTWVSVAGAVSYSIQYRPTSTSIWNSATSNVNTVTIAGLTGGTTYEFQVQVICSPGSSAYSSSDNFSTPSVTCAVVSGLSATSITSTSTLLQWPIVSGSTGYTVQYRMPGTTAWTYNTSNTNSLSLSGLTPGTTYEVQVQAICSATDSSGYSSSTLFTTLTTPCAGPSNLLATSITDTSALLSWITVAGATGYSIQYRLTGSATWVYTTSTIDSITISGLLPDTTYEFQVQTICSATDSSGYSISSTFSTTHTLVCPIPTGVVASNFSDTIILLNWTPTPGAISYSICYRAFGTILWNIRTASNHSIPITGLTPGTIYEFEVQAVCSATDSSGYSLILSSSPNSISNITSQDDAKSLSVYPNPTNENATISYFISSAESVSIRIYNIVGQEVIPAINEGTQQQGKHSRNVNIPVPGVYFIKLTVGESSITRKLIKL